jgi:CTP:phosphocholine cytidylyltransferase-like protein
MKMTDKLKNKLNEAQAKLSEAKELFDEFKYEYCDRLNHYQEIDLDDVIYELETLENKIDDRFELLEDA